MAKSKIPIVSGATIWVIFQNSVTYYNYSVQTFHDNCDTGYYGSHRLKYIEWIKLLIFWKKGVVVLQIYIDSDNWLNKNLISGQISSVNYVCSPKLVTCTLTI